MHATTTTRTTPDFTTDEPQLVHFWGHEAPYEVKFLGLCPVSNRRMYDMPGFPFPDFDTYNFVAEEYGATGPDFFISWLASQNRNTYATGLALARKQWASSAAPAEPAAALSAAMEVISRSEQTATSVTLPAGQLAPKLYADVKKILAAAGGKWSTKAAAFLFTRDPRPQLAQAVGTGKVVSTKKATQAYYTPAPIVAAMLSHLPANLTGLSILEPSAGEGAIADALKAAGAHVVCCEIDPESYKILRGKGHYASSEDFLTTKPGPYYDAVLMNPPFTKGQDIKHVTHAYNFLVPGGTLLAIISPAFQSNSTKAAQEFRELVTSQGEVLTTFEAGAFKESGTGVRTVLVKLTK